MVRWLALLCFFSANCYGEDWDFKVIKTETVTVESNTVDKDFYVVRFHTQYCPPCRAYESSGKLDRLKKIVYVVDVDLDEQPKWRNKVGLLPAVSRVPTFWLIKYKDKTKVTKSWEGAIEPETIAVEIKTRKTVSKPVKTYSSIYGQIGTSHESRATLINHLFNEGIHRGRHSLSQLNSMTDIQLNKLHEDDHGW